jgi:hypothetical protein
MSPVSSLRRLAIPSALLFCCVLLVAPASAQQDTIKDTLYASPTWGYTIRWHSDQWELVHDLSGNDLNVLGLSDDAGNFVVFTGLRNYAGDAAACLDDMRAGAFADPDNRDQPAVEPEILFEWSDEHQAYVLLRSTSSGGNEPSADVLYLECQTLVPGEAVFQRFYSAPADVFDRSFDDVVDLLESVHLPASGWLPEDEDDPAYVWAGYAPLLDEGRLNATLFPLDGEDPRLLIGLVDEAGDTRVVTFENVSDRPVLVEPANLALIYTSLFDEVADQIHRPYAMAWEDGVKSNADGSRTIAPGERATVHVQIAPIEELTMDCDAFPFLALEYRQSDDVFSDITGDFGPCLDDRESATA